MGNKYIVSLREDIGLGAGFTKRLDVSDYSPDLEMSSFLSLTLMDGRKILVNKNNIKSIVPVTQKKSNENY